MFPNSYYFHCVLLTVIGWKEAKSWTIQCFTIILLVTKAKYFAFQFLSKHYCILVIWVIWHWWGDMVARPLLYLSLHFVGWLFHARSFFFQNKKILEKSIWHTYGLSIKEVRKSAFSFTEHPSWHRSLLGSDHETTSFGLVTTRSRTRSSPFN